jgi:PAS domain S-box-containing protein
MTADRPLPGKSLPIRRYLVLVALGWTLLLGASYVWHLHEEEDEVIGFALTAARAQIQTDLTVRRWNASHGGVYVPVDNTTPPNPYLSAIPDRDIPLPGGRLLTLVNPAYMTRQVHEIGRMESGVKGHITSLKPIRPENAPDAWEREALESFERGAKEYSALLMYEGAEHFRLMQPLVTEVRCLKCHAADGYKAGDIRGGLSVSIPMSPFRDNRASEVRSDLATHFSIWCVGLLMMAFGGRSFAGKVREREIAESELARSERENRALVDAIPDAVFVNDREGRFKNIRMRPAVPLPVPPDEALGRTFAELFPPALADEMHAAVGRAIDTGEVQSGEYSLQTPDGEAWFEARVARRGADDALTLVRNVTGRKRSEANRLQLEERLRDARKMEAVGKLAGGIAHDFNNNLMVILGYLDLVLKRTPEGDVSREHLLEIRKAGESSRDIVRQLLAFSRRQVVSPKPVDLNAHIAGMEMTLGRLIGEDVRLVFSPGTELWTISIDPAQLGQVLVNLAVNARDAMPRGGTLMLSTANIAVPSGEFVRLSASDTGTGMSRETMAHAFEPFYTTKEVGQGTGLGLATVYGIVTQNGGYIELESEQDKGTRFDLHFPRAAGTPEVPPGRATVPPPASGPAAGTILLIEDDPAVRSMVGHMVESLGYRVIRAGTPEEAIAACGDPGVTIDLVLSDVVMPGMSGKEACDRIAELRPGLPTLFMSGYTDDIIARHGIPEAGISFIQKPFDVEALASKIRETLGG